jgi:hypothetical protein
MDGLTTNGVLVMHPQGGFTEESQPGVWREISVCGDVYTLRETRSAQQRGKLVSRLRSGKFSQMFHDGHCHFPADKAQSLCAGWSVPFSDPETIP